MWRADNPMGDEGSDMVVDLAKHTPTLKVVWLISEWSEGAPINTAVVQMMCG